MLAVGAVVVVLAGYFVVSRIVNPAPSQGDDPSNDIPQLQSVKTYDYVGGDHTTDPVTYSETPPAGGPHDPSWEDCGVYPEQPRNENVVHSLEHGTVWVTYQPDLSPADVQSLETSLGTVKSEKTILSPYPGQSSPVVVTVWNAQLALDGPDDPRLPLFLDFYGDGHTSPEGAQASCKGGVQVLASDAP